MKKKKNKPQNKKKETMKNNKKEKEKENTEEGTTIRNIQNKGKYEQQQ